MIKVNLLPHEHQTELWVILVRWAILVFIAAWFTVIFIVLLWLIG